MTKDEALMLALEALISCRNLLEIEVNRAIARDAADAWIQEKEAELHQHNNAITAIKAALEAKDEKDGSPCPEFWDWLPKAYRNGDADDLPKFTKYNMEVAFLAGKQSVVLEAKDELMGWKLVPIEPTNEMLKAMDKCSTEGYDERLPAGIASSVYMAAVEVAPKPPQQKINNEPKCVAIVEVFGKDWRLDYMALPVGKHKLYAQQYLYTTLPPQRTWVGLTDEEVTWLCNTAKSHEQTWGIFVRAIEAKLKEKNT